MILETKQALAKNHTGTFSCRLVRFLLKEHTTVSTSTGKTPAALVFGCQLSTALICLQPHETERMASDCRGEKSPRGVAVAQSILRLQLQGKPCLDGGNNNEGIRTCVLDDEVQERSSSSKIESH